MPRARGSAFGTEADVAFFTQGPLPIRKLTAILWPGNLQIAKLGQSIRDRYKTAVGEHLFSMRAVVI
jgi:hypothetical protein